MLAKQYLIGAYHLLPQHSPPRPTDVVVTLSSKMVDDFTPQLSTGPDIVADA